MAQRTHVWERYFLKADKYLQKNQNSEKSVWGWQNCLKGSVTKLRSKSILIFCHWMAIYLSFGSLSTQYCRGDSKLFGCTNSLLTHWKNSSRNFFMPSAVSGALSSDNNTKSASCSLYKPKKKWSVQKRFSIFHKFSKQTFQKNVEKRKNFAKIKRF